MTHHFSSPTHMSAFYSTFQSFLFRAQNFQNVEVGEVEPDVIDKKELGISRWSWRRQETFAKKHRLHQRQQAAVWWLPLVNVFVHDTVSCFI